MISYPCCHHVTCQYLIIPIDLFTICFKNVCMNVLLIIMSKWAWKVNSQIVVLRWRGGGGWTSDVIHGMLQKLKYPLSLYCVVDTNYYMHLLWSGQSTVSTVSVAQMLSIGGCCEEDQMCRKLNHFSSLLCTASQSFVKWCTLSTDVPNYWSVLWAITSSKRYIWILNGQLIKEQPSLRYL